MHHHYHQHRDHERHMMGRRGHRFEGFPGDGHGGHGGPGGFGGEFRLKRMLRGQDLRLVVLLLIGEAPRHGYDLIKAMEEKSAEAYSPSPGVIYPALTYLEEAGFATAEMDGSKKVYAITDAGSTHLDANRAEAEAALETLALVGKRAKVLRAQMAERQEAQDRDIPGVLPEVNEARRALKSAIVSAVRGDEATQRRLAEILRRAAEDIGKSDIDI